MAPSQTCWAVWRFTRKQVSGAAIVNMLRPGVHHVTAAAYVNRLDVVWDQYFPESLKAETRSKRGKGVCRRVEPQNTIPGNWQEFLRINDR